MLDISETDEYKKLTEELELNVIDVDQIFKLVFVCFQVKSDFITEEPKDLKGAIALYRNISRYLGSRETNYENSVPQAVILQPIKEVRHHLEHK